MRPAKSMIKQVFRKGWIYVCSAILIMFTCFPFFWMTLSSFRPEKELFASPPSLFPKAITLENYLTLLRVTNFLDWFKNSCLVSGFAVIVIVILASLGGYSLSRYNYRGRRLIAHFMVFLPMMPPLLIAVPLLMILVKAHLANSHIGIILAFIGALTPFCTWMMWSFIQGTAPDAEEAARIDGASTFQVLRYIVLPLARPGIIAIAVFSFIATWVNYTYPFILLSSEELSTLSIGIGAIYSNSILDFEVGLLLASSTMATIPGLILFLWLQRYFVKAWGLSGFK